MITLLDLPSDILNIALPLSNLDRKMLKYTCKEFCRVIPIQHLFYDNPINCPFEQTQLQLLLSPKCIKKNNTLLLAKNAIKRSRIDLLPLLIAYSSQHDLSNWRRMAAMVGNLEVYKHIFDLCPVNDSRHSDDMEALSYGHVHIFNYLKANYKTRHDEHGMGASVGAIRSNKLEIVIDVFDRGYTFGKNCIQHATNLDVIKWLHAKGFIVTNYTIEEMAKHGSLETIKWFDKMNFITRDELFKTCLRANFIDGVKYLLDSGYVADKNQMNRYENLVKNNTKPWYQWLNSGFMY